MKHILLAAVLLPVMLRAQVPQPVSQRVLPSSFQPSATNLPDNYQVTLNITDKDGQQPLEVSVVVASSQFSAQLAEQSLSFSGNMSVEESGGITIGYTLGWQTPVTANNGSSFQYLPSNTPGQRAPQARRRGADHQGRHPHRPAFREEAGGVEGEVREALLHEAPWTPHERPTV